MIINLNLSTLEMPSDETYSVLDGSKVKVFRNGDELKGCVYCNVSRGVAICLKRDLSGNIIVANGDIVHDLVFGCITVKPMSKD